MVHDDREKRSWREGDVEYGVLCTGKNGAGMFDGRRARCPTGILWAGEVNGAGMLDGRIAWCRSC